jgi:hypothetical protein
MNISILSPKLFCLAAAQIDLRGWIKNAEVTQSGVCLTGALKVCQLQPGDWLLARAVLRLRGYSEEWNDAAERKKEEVLGWLLSAEPITCAELEECFGPSYRRVAFVIRTVAGASAEQLDQLAAARDATRAAAWAAAGAAASDAAKGDARAAAWAAARDAAWDAAKGDARAAARAAAWAAARDAAWDAAWYAAWAAARDAAWDAAKGDARAAARDAAWAAARDAAWDAAWYAAIYDLIGHYGYTKEHSELLTKPFISVFGEIGEVDFNCETINQKN